jgi:hypothetical protein
MRRSRAGGILPGQGPVDGIRFSNSARLAFTPFAQLKKARFIVRTRDFFFYAKRGNPPRVARPEQQPPKPIEGAERHETPRISFRPLSRTYRLAALRARLALAPFAQAQSTRRFKVSGPRFRDPADFYKSPRPFRGRDF